MDEIIDLSDTSSEDTIIVPAADINNILKKYKRSDCKINNLEEIIKYNLDEEDDFDEITDNYQSVSSPIKTQTNKDYFTDNLKNFNDFGTSVIINSNDNNKVKKTSHQTVTISNNKTAIREQKKIEKELEKQQKNLLKIIENSKKPDECLKFITVLLDQNIERKSYGKIVKKLLEDRSYKYEIIPQFSHNIITWIRSIPIIENAALQTVQQEEEHGLLIMEIAEFLDHILENTLIAHIQSHLSSPKLNHLTIAVLGLERFYKYLKEKKNKEFKNNVTEFEQKMKSTNSYEFNKFSSIEKPAVEKKLVELQIYCKNLYIRHVESYEELALFVGECTKSVAQIFYKSSKSESLQLENELFTTNNRDCVRIDKNGNGLNRYWNQILRIFPLASLETAEAITSTYPTINSLIEAYKKCATVADAEKLLQNLPVRRSANILVNERKLGPELSKKVYNFFNAQENLLL